MATERPNRRCKVGDMCVVIDPRNDFFGHFGTVISGPTADDLRICRRHFNWTPDWVVRLQCGQEIVCDDRELDPIRPSAAPVTIEQEIAA